MNAHECLSRKEFSELSNSPTRLLLIIYFSRIWPNFTEIGQIVVTLKSVRSKRKLKFEKTGLEKKIRYTNKYRPLTPLWKISQSFCKLLFLPVTSRENFLVVLHVLAFQGNQLLHHFVGYLRCLLYVDFVIRNRYEKNKTRTEAVLMKQSSWAEAEAAEAGKIISTKRYGNIGEPP